MKQQAVGPFLAEEHLRLMRINFQLCKAGCLLELKNQLSHRLIVFRQTELLDTDRRVLLKTNKIVFNIKHYSDHAYRQFIKQMRASSKARQGKPVSDQPLCKQDHCLQLENTLKLLKNYLKKQILNYDFAVPRKDRLGVSSMACKNALSDEFRQFKLQTNLEAVSKSNIADSGPVHRKLFRAFRKWERLALTEKL